MCDFSTCFFVGFGLVEKLYILIDCLFLEPSFLEPVPDRAQMLHPIILFGWGDDRISQFNEKYSEGAHCNESQNDNRRLDLIA